MRRFFSTLTVLLLLFRPLSSQGCGDKLIVLGRGFRFSALIAERPVAILAFAPEGSDLGTVLKDPQWLAAMNKGKHRLRLLQSIDDIRPVLSRESYDLVLVDVSEAPRLKQAVQSSSSDPIVVPVMNGAKRDEVQIAEKEYGVVLKAESKAKAYLSGISKAVELRDWRMQVLAQARKKTKAS
jgi:hypothetical protein